MGSSLQPLLAAQPPLWKLLIVALVMLVGNLLFLGMLVAVLYFYRGYEWLAKRALAKAYRGLKIHDPPQAGDVLVSYPTHHGIIAWSTEICHVAAAPPEDAQILLGRLLRFNLCFAAVAHPCVVLVPLGIFNYLAQKRSIRRQETALQMACLEPAKNPAIAEHRIPDLAALQRKQAEPSQLLQVVGYGAAAMAPIFAIQGIAGIFMRDIRVAGGSVIAVVGAVLVAEAFTKPGVFSTMLRKFRDWRTPCCSVCGGKSSQVGPLQQDKGGVFFCGNCVQEAVKATKGKFDSEPIA